MKKKIALPKITLSKETIRQLENPKDLREAVGGFSYVQSMSGCRPCFAC